jgi:hypothetical protein
LPPVILASTANAPQLLNQGRLVKTAVKKDIITAHLINNMAYNPNSKYGRRRNREEFRKSYDSKSPDEKREFDNTVGCVTVVIGLIIAIIYIFVKTFK